MVYYDVKIKYELVQTDKKRAFYSDLPWLIWEKSLTRGGELDIFKHDISESNSEEREVLFKKGSIFFVVARDGNTIYLEEI